MDVVAAVVIVQIRLLLITVTVTCGNSMFLFVLGPTRRSATEECLPSIMSIRPSVLHTVRCNPSDSVLPIVPQPITNQSVVFARMAEFNVLYLGESMLAPPYVCLFLPPYC